MEPDLEFKFRLLLRALRVTCRFFEGRTKACKLSNIYDEDVNELADGHLTDNCYGQIDKCDLPEKYQDLWGI